MSDQHSQGSSAQKNTICKLLHKHFLCDENLVSRCCELIRCLTSFWCPTCVSDQESWARNTQKSVIKIHTNEFLWRLRAFLILKKHHFYLSWVGFLGRQKQNDLPRFKADKAELELMSLAIKE